MFSFLIKEMVFAAGNVTEVQPSSMASMGCDI